MPAGHLPGSTLGKMAYTKGSVGKIHFEYIFDNGKGTIRIP